MCAHRRRRARRNADERDIVDEFLFQLSDVALVPVATERMRHSWFSQRAIRYDLHTCTPDPICQPCLNWKTYEDFECFAQLDAKIKEPKGCAHSI